MCDMSSPRDSAEKYPGDSAHVSYGSQVVIWLFFLVFLVFLPCNTQLPGKVLRAQVRVIRVPVIAPKSIQRQPSCNLAVFAGVFSTLACRTQ